MQFSLHFRPCLDYERLKKDGILGIGGVLHHEDAPPRPAPGGSETSREVQTDRGRVVRLDLPRGMGCCEQRARLARDVTRGVTIGARMQWVPNAAWSSHASRHLKHYARVDFARLGLVRVDASERGVEQVAADTAAAVARRDCERRELPSARAVRRRRTVPRFAGWLPLRARAHCGRRARMGGVARPARRSGPTRRSEGTRANAPRRSRPPRPCRALSPRGPCSVRDAGRAPTSCVRAARGGTPARRAERLSLVAA